ncbi:tyrosine-type recombinase/integrase [Pseudodesulfovibrio nedwellii]|nr:site-specific integrase [Pseudodesulfovibrio nedwellii]
MAISVQCTSCYCTYKLGTKSCRKCKTNLQHHRKYKVMVKIRGRWKTKTVDSLKLAEQIEAKWKHDITIAAIMPEKIPVPTMQEVWDRFDKLHNSRLKSPRSWRKVWETRVQKRFGEIRLNEISPQDIAEFMCSMKSMRKTKGTRKPLAMETVAKNIKLVSRLFNYAIKNGLYEGINPTQKLDMPRYDNQVTNPLTDAELDRLMAVLDTWKNRMVALAFLFCLATGKRTGEVFNMTWQDVDYENNVIRFEIKSMVKGRYQYLPINDMMKNILAEAQAEKRTRSKLVFHSTNGKKIHYRWPWTRIKAAAKLRPKIRPHDLRHTFASRLISTGKVDLYTLQHILGHKTVTMTQRYAHLADELIKKGMKEADNILRYDKD